jgi:hypothetical protein
LDEKRKWLAAILRNDPAHSEGGGSRRLSLSVKPIIAWLARRRADDRYTLKNVMLLMKTIFAV